MIIDHICYAVKNLNDGISFWENMFGYKQMTNIIVNSRQQVKVTFLEKEDSITIKLIEPVETNQSLLNFVNKGGGYHHVCFKCSKLDEKMNELKEKGMVPLVSPRRAKPSTTTTLPFFCQEPVSISN